MAKDEAKIRDGAGKVNRAQSARSFIARFGSDLDVPLDSQRFAGGGAGGGGTVLKSAEDAASLAKEAAGKSFDLFVNAVSRVLSGLGNGRGGRGGPKGFNAFPAPLDMDDVEKGGGGSKASGGEADGASGGSFRDILERGRRRPGDDEADMSGSASESEASDQGQSASASELASFESIGGPEEAPFA